MLDESISEIMEVELMRMARRGSRRGQADSARAQGIGTASRVSVKNITAALKLLSPAAAQRLSHFMEAARSYFGLVFGRTAAINKAERDGKFDREGADAFIGQLFGLDAQDANDTPAAEALREILDISPAAFSHRGVKPLPFAENVAKAIAGKLPANAILDFGTPGPVLLQAGVPDLPMLIRLGKMREKAKKHPELTREILEGLPAALQNPMAVFTSPGDGKAHGIVTSVATSQGPVTAYFSLRDFSGKAVLEAKSIYGRLPVKYSMNSARQRTRERSPIKTKRPSRHGLLRQLAPFPAPLCQHLPSSKTCGSFSRMTPQVKTATPLSRWGPQIKVTLPRATKAKGTTPPTGSSVNPNSGFQMESRSQYLMICIGIL